MFAKTINANSLTIKNIINNGSLFRGLIYITKQPLSVLDIEKPKINLNDKDELYKFILEIKNNFKIKQPIFIFNAKNNEFLIKYDGIIIAEKELNIRHEIIKKHILSKSPYLSDKNIKGCNNFIFSYHRLLNL